MNKSVLAIVLALLSLLGSGLAGFFTWNEHERIATIEAQNKLDLEELKAKTQKDFEVVKANIEAQKVLREADTKESDARNAQRAERCRNIEQLRASMAQSLQQSALDFSDQALQNILRMRADAVTALTLLGPEGKKAYQQASNMPPKAGEASFDRPIAAAVVALTIESSLCNR